MVRHGLGNTVPPHQEFSDTSCTCLPFAGGPRQVVGWVFDRLTALLKEHTPVSRPSRYSKPWWTSHPTTLRREFHKAARMARGHGTPALRDLAHISKVGYFKAIKTAKNKYWSSFLLGATPQTLWTAKKFAYG